eukprot:5906976-Amphidinium_carterae.1
MLDDDMYAVPGFTGEPSPRSPNRQGQQKGSRLKSPRDSESPKGKPRKTSTSPREDQGSKPDGEKNVCRMWKTSGTCRFGDKCKYSHDTSAVAAEVSEQEVVMIAALHDPLDDAEAHLNLGKTDALTRASM